MFEKADLNTQDNVVVNSNSPAIDYSLLGAKPKIKPSKISLLIPLPEKVEKNVITRNKSEEKSGQNDIRKSKDKTNMMSIDKESKIIDKVEVKSDDKIIKIVDKISEAGEKVAVKDCHFDVPFELDIHQKMKAKQTYLLKLKSYDDVGSTAGDMSPTRGNIKAGKVAEIRGKFDRVTKENAKECLLNIKRLQTSSPKPVTPGNSRQKKAQKRSAKKRVIDTNQRLIDYYLGKTKEADDVQRVPALDDDEFN